MVSRVFQKSGGGSGGKKTRAAGSGVYTDTGSPSTSSLPPLLDSSVYTSSGGQESCSYESESAREHVPCFSTVPAAVAATFGHPPASMNGAPCGFPSLRSLQENLQLPFFFSAVAQQNEMGGASGNWAESEQKVVVERSGRQDLQQMGTTELDCLWNYSAATRPF